MTQEQLELAVARATGEPIANIRRRGFGLLCPFDPCFDSVEADHGPHLVDWDELALERPSLFP